MNNSFFKSIILTFIFVTSLFASNEEINQKLFELKKSQEYAQELNDEKTTLIMGQIIQKENEIKDLEKKLKNYVNKEDLTREITYQNNRIEDINSSVDSLSIIVSVSIGLFGILITAIVIFFALRFEKIARVQADKEVKNWIDEKADKEFKPKVDSYLAQIDGKAKKLFYKIESEYNDLFSKIVIRDIIELNKKEKIFKYNEKIKFVLNNFEDKMYQKEVLENIDILLNNVKNKKEIIAVSILKAITLMDSESKKALSIFNTIINEIGNTNEKNELKFKAYAYIGKGLILEEEVEIKQILTEVEELIKNLDGKDKSQIQEYINILASNKKSF